MATVTLNQPGEDVTVGGSDVLVNGTNSGGEEITVVGGNIRLNTSFTQGGDTIILPGDAAEYSAYSVGAEVYLVRDDGLVSVRIPTGANGNEIRFDNGDQRTLVFDSADNRFELEGQAISNNRNAPTDITPAGPPPLVGYDVVGSDTAVVEGDAGTRAMVFTITLDRPVTAADGPVSLNYVTQDGSADSASDYIAAAGQVVFAVGQQTATVTIQVVGDTIPEASETLQLLLSGAQLRNGPEQLTGTIANDDASVGLSSKADNFTGSAGDDSWFAANNDLGAGDKISDPSTGDNDTFSLAVDPGNTNSNYGGFALTNVERVEVTNDSGKTVTLDLSSSTGIETVASVNSSDTVIFNQLTSLASVEVNNVTGANADVQAIYQAAVTAGATSVDVVVKDATVDDIILGTVGAGNTGIETVNMMVAGNSVIDSLDTALTNLNITGDGSIKIDTDLNDSVRSIDATGVAGNLDISFDGNDGAAEGVTFLGAQGDNFVESGEASDNITTFEGNDTVIDEGGNDVIRTNGGNDTVISGGVGGFADIDTGAGDDTVDFGAGLFSGNDRVAMGGDAGDRLIVREATVETDYQQVTGATTLDVRTSGSTVLGNNGNGSLGEAAGIKVVDLNLAGLGGGNNTLDAQDYAGPLTVNLGGVASADTVLLGNGDDIVNTSSFGDTDNIQGNGGFDTINVQDGATSITTGSLFSGVEQINYLSDGDGQDHSLVVDADNAPTVGNKLTVNGAELAADEVLTYDSTAANFASDVRGGAAGDNINTNNNFADEISSAGGADTIVAGGGDLVNSGSGADNVTLVGGNNTVNAGSDGDTVTLGTGIDIVNGDDGDDRLVVTNSADLTAADTLNGGADTDTLSVQGTFVDAQFTGTSNIEALEGRDNGGAGANNITIGAEAQEGGIRTVNLLDVDADTLQAKTYTADLTVNLSGGSDVVETGSGNDRVVTASTGNVNLTLNSGDDTIEVSGKDWTYADKANGGQGSDTMLLDNSTGAVTTQVDLDNVTAVERFVVKDDGDRVIGITDSDNNTLNFRGGNVGSLTTISVDASALTDIDDTFTMTIEDDVDQEFQFNIVGSATADTLVRELTLGGSNTNITFDAGDGNDTVKIGALDLGGIFNYDGGDGQDTLFQLSDTGVIQDDDFVGVANVEVLSGDTVTQVFSLFPFITYQDGIDAILGSAAADSGLVKIQGTAGDDQVTLDAGFNAANLEVVLGGSSNNAIGDDINGSASATTITFVANDSELRTNDDLSGGTGAQDRLRITATGGTANIGSVTGVEFVDVIDNTVPNVTSTLVLDTKAGEVNGGVQTITAVGFAAGDSFTLNGTNATAVLDVTGGAGADNLTTGSGNDIVNAGAGADVVITGSGNDTVNAGEGIDTVRGQGGDDIINGDAGDDTLYGDIAYGDIAGTAYVNAGNPGTQYTGYNASGGGADTIDGGAGNDTIVGGLLGDTLTGGEGADIFLYQTRDDSRVFPGGVDNRDTITDFVSGVDKIDLLSLPEATGQTVRFNGNWDTFGEGQGAVSGTGGDGFLDGVFVRETGTLWIDIDNNGQLNGEDMQIILQGVDNLVAADVNNPHLVTGPTQSSMQFEQVQSMLAPDSGSMMTLGDSSASFESSQRLGMDSLAWHHTAFA
jgi:Ca2+-binding RTX toxin-like protein